VPEGAFNALPSHGSTSARFDGSSATPR